jgi:hypothetical protein
MKIAIQLPGNRRIPVNVNETTLIGQIKHDIIKALQTQWQINGDKYDRIYHRYIYKYTCIPFWMGHGKKEK